MKFGWKALNLPYNSAIIAPGALAWSKHHPEIIMHQSKLNVQGESFNEYELHNETVTMDCGIFWQLFMLEWPLQNAFPLLVLLER